MPLPTPPPALGGRFGAAVKSTVAVLVVLAIVLVTWQVADHMNDTPPAKATPSEKPSSAPPTPTTPPPPRTIKAVAAQEIGIEGYPRNPELADRTIDGDPNTMWKSDMLVDGPQVTFKRKGYGIVYDLGSPQDVRRAKVDLGAAGPSTRITLRAAPGATTMPSEASEFTVDMGSTTTPGDSATVEAEKAVKTQFLLVTMTENPSLSIGTYSGYRVTHSGYQNAWREVTFTT